MTSVYKLSPEFLDTRSNVEAYSLECSYRDHNSGGEITIRVGHDGSLFMPDGMLPGEALLVAHYIANSGSEPSRHVMDIMERFGVLLGKDKAEK